MAVGFDVVDSPSTARRPKTIQSASHLEAKGRPMVRPMKVVGVVLFAILALLTIPSQSSAQIAVGISIHIGPPALPVYPQPICPAPGYIWTPGYWAYGPYGYYWVPGTWVLAPTPGFLWTPGYWGWVGGAYVWHGGYWGPHVGFYGGINYGFGYTGVGFFGGEWRGGVYHYNTAVTNVNTTVIHNTYINNVTVNKTVVNNVSYNGGTGGTTAQPTAAERTAMSEQHMQPTALQTQHEQMARNDHSLLASVNHGQPAIAATAKPGVFKGSGVVAAHAAVVNGNHPGGNTNTHLDRPPSARTNTYSSNSNGNKPNYSMDHPQTVPHNNNSTNTYKPNNNGTHVNNDRPYNSPKTPQPSHESKPQEHETPHHEGHGR